VRLDLVPPHALPWIIACWLLAAGLAVLILVPGATQGVVAERSGSSGLIGRFDAPLGIRVLLVAAGAVLAGILAVVQRHRDGHPLVRELGLAVAAGFPVLALAADRSWGLAAAALVLLVAAEIVAHRRTLADRRATTIVALLVAAIWGVLLLAQFAVRDAGAGWTWIALFGFAAAFAAFGSYYGVARAAESRSRLLRPLFRDTLPAVAVAGIVLAVVVVTSLRLTVARELFPEPDPGLWTPLAAAPLSWLHAALVAGLVVLLAAWSARHPLRRSRERGVTAALAVAGNADLAAGVLVIVAGLVVAAATGEVLAPDIPPVLVAALKFAGVGVITATALLPPFRGTAARALALITGAYLVPLTLHGLLVQAGVALPPGVAGYPATPVQVALLLLAVAVVGAALPGLRRMLGPGLVVRLAVVPLVAVHAGWLLPAAWSDLGRIVLVVGVVLALLFLLPELSADRDRHALDLLTASAGQVLALAVFVLALPSFLDDPQLVVLGLFWLAVTVIAALTVRTVGEDEPGAA
jgi:hypothetical protein